MKRWPGTSNACSTPNLLTRDKHLQNKSRTQGDHLKRTITFVLLLVLSACSTKQTSNNNQPAPAPVAPVAGQPGQPSASAKPIDALKEGEASGSIVAEGQTINVKYAYAGHGEMFKEDAIVVLLTEAPIAPDVLANAFKESFGIFPRDNKGLEYKVSSQAFWVMYHPNGFQTSGINTLKDYSVENGIVKGRDEDTTNFSGSDYKRSVSFVARVMEKQK
jgi:hypothetical protein